MIEIEDMRAFVEVSGSGGFTRAASKLGIAKSVVSRRIAKMERDLGVQLLSRTTRGVSLTDAGAEFRIRCERIVEEYDDARDAAAAHRGDVVGKLRLAAPNSFAKLLAPTLVDMARRHPKLEIDASFTDRVVDIVAERFDAAIRVGQLPDSTMVARRIIPVRSIVAASPEYLAKAGRPRVPAELSDHACLIYAMSAIGGWSFRVGGRWSQVNVGGRFRSDNGETIIDWAMAGLGIIHAPTYQMQQEPQSFYTARPGHHVAHSVSWCLCRPSSTISYTCTLELCLKVTCIRLLPQSLSSTSYITDNRSTYT
ncbi:MAG: LysR family transcriptional regulator, partial [Verrucomicrobiaceae bacterium]